MASDPAALSRLINAFRERETFWYEPGGGVLARTQAALARHEEIVRQNRVTLQAAEAQAKPISDATSAIPGIMNKLDKLDDDLRRARRDVDRAKEKKASDVIKIGPQDLAGTDDWVQRRADRANAFLEAGDFKRAKAALKMGWWEWMWMPQNKGKRVNTRVSRQSALDELRKTIDARREAKGATKSGISAAEKNSKSVEKALGKEIHGALRDGPLRQFLTNERVQAEMGADPTYKFLKECSERNWSAKRIAEVLHDRAKEDPKFNLEFHKLNVMADRLCTKNSEPVVAAREALKRAEDRLHAAQNVDHRLREIAAAETTTNHYGRADTSIANGLEREALEGDSPALRRHAREFSGRKSRFVDTAQIERFVRAIESENFDPSEADISGLRHSNLRDGVDWAKAASRDAFNRASETAKSSARSAFERARDWWNEGPDESNRDDNIVDAEWTEVNDPPPEQRPAPSPPLLTGPGSS